jgi:2'-5' RNA ligase
VSGSPEVTATGQSATVGGRIRRSAVIVPIEIPPRLARLRGAADPMAALGVPAHVTILFPFLPVERLGQKVRSMLAAIAAACPAFAVRFGRVERLEGLVWLIPDDAEPFLRLTADVFATWPDHPPYEGIHDELIPHLTVVESADGAAQDAASTTAAEVGAFTVAATELTVITEAPSGRWRTRWRLPLGARHA